MRASQNFQAKSSGKGFFEQNYRSIFQPGAPLYCGPDGLPLTQEERAFLEENLGRLDSSTTESNEDLEIQNAYAEFLASQQEQK